MRGEEAEDGELRELKSRRGPVVVESCVGVKSCEADPREHFDEATRCRSIVASTTSPPLRLSASPPHHNTNGPSPCHQRRPGHPQRDPADRTTSADGSEGHSMLLMPDAPDWH
jgi:hypothetical protein